ncbi:hypothetical protein [Paenibacillus sp. 1P07SE]|uniref:hypothetical protein n=1 Tax=Paenibacillus sp. 1P07SE TaxID=3132209 RepID=UPI0039A654CC
MDVLITVLIVSVILITLPLILIYRKKVIYKFIGLTLLLIFMGFGFYLMNRISLSPTEVSRGNVGVLFLPVAVIPLIVTGFILITKSYFFFGNLNSKMLFLLLSPLLLLGFLLINPVLNRFQNYANNFGSPNDKEGSAFFNKLWLNEYTYNIVFNSTTFIFVIVIFLTIGCLISFVRR